MLAAHVGKRLGRPVVDDDYLEPVTDSLAVDSFERGPQVHGGTVGADDHAYVSWHAGVSLEHGIFLGAARPWAPTNALLRALSGFRDLRGAPRRAAGRPPEHRHWCHRGNPLSHRLRGTWRGCRRG